MKKFLIPVFAAIMLTGCAHDLNRYDDLSNGNPDVVNNGEAVPLVLTEAQVEILSNGNEFALGFFRDIAAAEKKGNVFVSPFSLQAALSMLSNGAEGETYAEIAKALGWEDYDIDAINGLYEIMVGGLSSVDPLVAFAPANSVWTSNDLPVKADFVSALKNHYQAEAQNINFSSSSAVQTINKWCSDKTRGLIPNIVNQIDPETRMLLINALYFRGVWSQEFDPGKTRTSRFYHADGSRENLKFMNLVHMFMGVHTEKFQAVELPYGDQHFVMDILLPAENIDFDKFVAELDLEFWKQTLRNLHALEVTLSLPKFEQEFTGEKEIVDFLIKRGMVRAFSGTNAQFGKISTEPLYVSTIKQKAKFRMDERGAEAAALTAVLLIGNAIGAVYETPKMTLNANRPFVYVLREKTSGAILFMGTFKGTES